MYFCTAAPGHTAVFFQGVSIGIPQTKFGKFRIFSKLSKFPLTKFRNGQASQGRRLSISNFGTFGKLESWKKNGKHAPAGATPLGNSPAKANKDDVSAHQAVQDEAFFSSAATRGGFSTATRPHVDNLHGSHSVAATIRPPEVRRTTTTREWLYWDDHSDKPEREGTFQKKYRLFSRMRCAPGSSHTYCGGF